MVNVNEAGVYAVSYQIAMAIALINSSFNKAWVPHAYEQIEINKKTSKIKLVKKTYLYFGMLFLSFLALIFSIDIIFDYFINNSFIEAKKYVWIIGLGYVFNGMYTSVVVYFFYRKNTKLLAFLTVITGVLNLGLNYFFILWFGAIGAAYSTCISFLFQFLIVWYYANKQYSLPWFYFCDKI